MPILNGDRYTGVTLHVIDDGIDTGPIIDQKLFEIDADETAFSLYQKYIERGIELFQRNIRTILSGDIVYTSQDTKGSTYCGRMYIDPSKAELSTKMTWQQIDRFVRAYYFPVYQFASFQGRPVKRATLIERRSGLRLGPVALGQGYTDVQCIDALVRLWYIE